MKKKHYISTLENFHNLLKATHYFSKRFLTLEISETVIFLRFKRAFIKQIFFSETDFQKTFSKNFQIVLTSLLTPEYRFALDRFHCNRESFRESVEANEILLLQMFFKHRNVLVFCVFKY